MKQTQLDLFEDFDGQVRTIKTELKMCGYVTGYFVGNPDSKSPVNLVSKKQKVKACLRYLKIY